MAQKSVYVPAELHRELELWAVASGKTFSETVRQFLMEGLQRAQERSATLAEQERLLIEGYQMMAEEHTPQNDVATRLRENLIVVAFPSRVPSRSLPTQYLVRANSQRAQRAGLIRDCMVDRGVIHTITKSRIRRRVGLFTSEAMDDMDRCFKISLALV